MKLIRPYGLEKVYNADNFIAFGMEHEFKGEVVYNIVAYTKRSKRVLLVAFAYDDLEKNANEQESYYEQLLHWLVDSSPDHRKIFTFDQDSE